MESGNSGKLVKQEAEQPVSATATLSVDPSQSLSNAPSVANTPTPVAEKKVIKPTKGRKKGRKGHGKTAGKKAEAKKKEASEKETYDPENVNEPIPLEFKLYGYLIHGKQTVPHVVPCTIVERKLITEIEGTNLLSDPGVCPNLTIDDYFTCPPERHLPADSKIRDEWKNHAYIYYVHFQGVDRRMDEWVCISVSLYLCCLCCLFCVCVCSVSHVLALELSLYYLIKRDLLLSSYACIHSFYTQSDS